MEQGCTRVLLVDDDEDEYVLTRDLLTETNGAGLDLDWVATNEEAREAIRRAQHDVYLVDYRLGQQNGLELLREAVADGCTAPIILLTGQGGHEVDVAAMEAGAVDYLDKNHINSQLLERAIRYAISQKQAERMLRAYAADLEARNQDLDAYAHTVAHEIRGPLGHMVGYARLLEEDYHSLPEEIHLESLQAIAESGQKMINIVNELLLLAGLRDMEVKSRPVDLAFTAQEALRRLDYMVQEYDAEIVLPESWPSAAGYEPWVEEVWVNYVSNALKYGGRPPHVQLGAELQGVGTVRCWVRDNGQGLTCEEQGRLFTPLTRLEQVQVKGYGLGLSIVQRIVHKLGGQVGIESELGRGSTFFFTLPEVAGNGDCDG
jgi:signal transduction histidine kinase